MALESILVCNPTQPQFMKLQLLLWCSKVSKPTCTCTSQMWCGGKIDRALD